VDFSVVSVFIDRNGNPLRTGNPLAVFADHGGLGTAQMQAVARTFNLSETTFVTALHRDAYDVRIFTPQEELPFAGHPTIGTCWVLRHLGVLTGDAIEQRSEGGPTPVRWDGERLWLRRSGEPGEDLVRRDPEIEGRLARALGRDNHDIGLEARELGRPGRLGPAIADAGLPVLLVPVRDVAVLKSCSPRSDLLAPIDAEGVYCFTAVQAGRIRARGFFPGAGISEDPATGSAAAALGLYLAARVGAIDFEIEQGVEITRPCRMQVRAAEGAAEVGGRCALISSGHLERLP
jgi:trans-2,3-dihydro-3-hydroxyanthranilate isomerase